MEKKAKLTFLGTGTSSGVPMIACDCEVCRSADPRDKRLRASALVEYGGLTVLVDCGPDFRYQMLRADVRHLDAILLTHFHKDHTGGLDDIRAFNLAERHPVNIYCEGYVEQALRREYGYAFADQKYPGAPEWRVHVIDGAQPFAVHSNAGEEILSWERGFGYHHLPPQPAPDASVEIVPYLTDIRMLDSEAEFEKLKGVEYVTLGCVKIGEHHSHPSLQECLDFFEKVGAKESYITHMSHQLPRHADFAAMLPPHVHPAYDGLVIG